MSEMAGRSVVYLIDAVEVVVGHVEAEVLVHVQQSLPRVEQGLLAHLDEVLRLPHARLVSRLKLNTRHRREYPLLSAQGEAVFLEPRQVFLYALQPLHELHRIKLHARRKGEVRG